MTKNTIITGLLSVFHSPNNRDGYEMIGEDKNKQKTYGTIVEVPDDKKYKRLHESEQQQKCRRNVNAPSFKEFLVEDLERRREVLAEQGWSTTYEELSHNRFEIIDSFKRYHDLYCENSKCDAKEKLKNY